MEQREIFTQMALKAWQMQVSRTDKFLESISDDDLLKEIAPGRNRLTYLLGHLIAVHDNMISLFGLGARQYASLDEAFLKNPDRSGLSVPTATELRSYWKRSNELLTEYFNNMPVDDWFARHNSMTDEDLVKEPSRNKMSVLMNRTSHLAYHLGQMVLAK